MIASLYSVGQISTLSSGRHVEATYLHRMPRSEVFLFRSIESPGEGPGSKNRSFVRDVDLKWKDNLREKALEIVQ